MMAPKIGPRGITIEDVIDVANNGIGQTSATPYRSARFENAQPTATTPVDYAALLAGGPASTYGLKYAGQPSGEYAKQMILGAAMQAKSIGDLAALQASTNQQNLTSKFASDLLAGTNKLSPIFREKFNQPMLDSNNRNVQIQKLTPAISDLEARLAERKLYARRIGAYEEQRQGIGKQIDIIEAELRDARRAMGQVNPTGKTPEQLAAENKANAYGAYMDRMNMLGLTQPGSQVDFTNLSSLNNSTNQGAESISLQPGLPSLLRAGAQRQTATNLTPGLEAALAEQVTPYETVAAGFANTPLSQFAQQIAVNRYGYDPALAAGLFDTSVDVQSLKDQADLFAAQNPQLNMSPAEIVRYQFGEEALNQYLQQQAEQALYGTGSQQRTEAELAQDAANAPIDAELYSVYATAPGDLSSALNADVARQYMSDPNFLAQFQAGTTKIYDDMSQGVSGADAVNSYIRNYLNTTGDPVSARILEELLSNVSFG
jgi:hypothetical protein